MLSLVEPRKTIQRSLVINMYVIEVVQVCCESHEYTHGVMRIGFLKMKRIITHCSPVMSRSPSL
jgi:hypothetical protein